MQTRSQTRRSPPEIVVYNGDGAYTRTTPSATGQGTHIRWQYRDVPSSPTPACRNADTTTRNDQSKLLTNLTINSTRAFNSLFDGPLSPISEDDSSSASGGSFSSLFDGSLSSISSEGPTEEPPRTPPCNRAASFPSGPGPIRTPRNTVRASPQTPQPLHRSNGRRWRRGPTGELAPVTEDDIDDPLAPPISQPSFDINSNNGANSNANLNKIQGMSMPVDDVFEIHLGQMRQAREDVIEGMMGIDMTSDDEHEMNLDSVQMHLQGQSIATAPTSGAGTPVASGSGASQAQGSAAGGAQAAARLGPHGTELIDVSFSAPNPAQTSMYPQRWIRNQSTGLRSFPTENLEN